MCILHTTAHQMHGIITIVLSLLCIVCDNKSSGRMAGRPWPLFVSFERTLLCVSVWVCVIVCVCVCASMYVYVWAYTFSAPFFCCYCCSIPCDLYMSAIMLSIGLVHFDGYLVGLVSFCVASSPPSHPSFVSFVFDLFFCYPLLFVHTIPLCPYSIQPRTHTRT